MREPVFWAIPATDTMAKRSPLPCRIFGREPELGGLPGRLRREDHLFFVARNVVCTNREPRYDCFAPAGIERGAPKFGGGGGRVAPQQIIEPLAIGRE